uniref:G-protein coupled receptors family 1 profile domain-containing protein n=1 Tax=Plectus sambesii TaxID=2011161 RepID=A0A914VBT6_9BILA
MSDGDDGGQQSYWSSTEGYAANVVINEYLTDVQVRVFCALFVLFALASLATGILSLRLIAKYNYNTNRSLCLSTSSLLVACLIIGFFASLVKLLIHITPEMFTPWCKTQQYFVDLATNAGLLSIALVVWDVRALMQYSANHAHWTGADHRSRHIAIVWILCAILAARIPFLKSIGSAPGYAQIACCIYRNDVDHSLIIGELIATAAILLLIALLIGAAQISLNKGGSSPDTLHVTMALLFIAIVTKAPYHIFLIVSYLQQESSTDFGLILNALELLMFTQGWLTPVALVMFSSDLRMDLGGCCDHQRIAQNRLDGDNIQINQTDDDRRLSRQSRATKSLRSTNSPMPILHI